MKYLKQFGIILGIAYAGELLNYCIPLPVPASIYGIVILFLCLQFKILKVSAVKEVSNFLIEIMPVMFIPAAVGLLESWGILKPAWVQYITITVISTVLVMVVAGRVTQAVMRRGESKNE